MKRKAKLIMMLIAIAAVPAIAGLGVMALWNGIVTSACGFAEISFWQSVGLFVLGQLLSGGFLLMLFVVMGGIHSIGHHHEEWHDRWHKMNDEQRREFILSRRRHFGFHNRPQKEGDVTE